jgi:ketosteroid isomerase-like protein
MKFVTVVYTAVVICGCFPGIREVSMSPQERQHAIGLLRSAYAAFNRDDIPGAVEALDPAIEWEEPAEFPGGGRYRGRAEVARYLTQSRAGWAEGASEPVGFIVEGQRVVVYVEARFRAKGSGEWTKVELADVYTFRNGVPVAMRAFADRKAAVEWAQAGRVE